jgi:hypothetical protein
MADNPENKQPKDRDKSERITAVALSSLTLAGKPIAVGQVIEITEEMAEPLDKDNQIDVNEKAVAFALSENDQIIKLGA